VHQAVDDGGGDDDVAEDLASGFEAAIAGDDDRAACGAAGNEREQDIGGFTLDWEVADRVDGQRLLALQAFVVVGEGLRSWASLGGRPITGHDVHDSVAVLAGHPPVLLVQSSRPGCRRSPCQS
jgi:hypothetical protein